MTEVTVKALSPHAVARTQINEWRGRCLDLFAKGENAIADLLVGAAAANFEVKLHHLAGQRTKELAKLLDVNGPSKKQIEAGQRAIERWQKIETKRAPLAHGTLTATMDESGDWYAIFDMVDYRTNSITPIRLTISCKEADEMTNELKTALARLKGELGHIKKRLKLQPE